MKNIVTLLSFICCSHLAFPQSTMENFSTPGLNINAFSVNFVDDTTSASYSYSHKTVVCGDTALVFLHNTSHSPVYLVFEGQKVYRTNYSCVRYPLFDFGLNVGNRMSGGYCDFCLVVDKRDTMLLNGEKRIFMDLTSGSSHRYWIEGIGDTKRGVYPDKENETSWFICARDSTGDLLINTTYADKCNTYGCRRPLPDYNFDSDGLNTEFLNNSRFANQYDWEFGDGSTTTSYHATHTYNEPGCYTVRLTVRNDCYPDSSMISEAIPSCMGFRWDTLSTIDFVENFTVKTISDSLHFLINTYPYDMLFRSTDGARSWELINLPPIDEGELRIINDLEMYNDKRGILVTAGSDSDDQSAIYITNDGGQTWLERGLGDVWIGDIELGGNGIAYASGSSHYVHKSEDYGETWSDLTFYISRIDMIWNFGDTVLFGSIPNFQTLKSSIVKSLNGGYTWDTISIPDPIKRFIFLSPQDVIGYDIYTTGIYKSYDGGQSWTLHFPQYRLFALNMFDETRGWFSDYNGIVYYTEDAFETLQIIKCGPKYIFDISPGSSASAIISDARHLMSFKGSIGFPCLDPDNDGDGYHGEADCDDNNFYANPAGIEIPNNDIDEDCDGVDWVTSVHELNGIQVTIYPNPVMETIYVKSSNPENFTLHLYDLRGKLLSTQTGADRIDIYGLVDGMYLIEIIDKDQRRIVEKVIKI